MNDMNYWHLILRYPTMKNAIISFMANGRYEELLDFMINICYDGEGG